MSDKYENPFKEFMAPPDQEEALANFKKELDGIANNLIISTLRTFGFPDEATHVVDLLIKNGCPPISILKTMLELGKEGEHKDGE